MKKIILLLTVIFFSVFNLSSQIPQTISWQGILQDADSRNLSGTYSLTVKLYDVATGGTAIWNETHSSVVITDGLVNLTLGNVTPFSVNFDKQYWLEITVGTGTPLPRLKLSSVPYALHSKTAESANETDPTWSGNSNTTGTISRSGKVGIGTSSPTALLHILDSETNAGDVLFVGNVNWIAPRNPPISSGGTRMMWYSDKAAFRVGHVSGSHWDMNNIGVGSVAMGSNTIASYDMSMAFGTSTVASQYASFAFGAGTLASGNVATAFGNNTVASGMRATATGDNTTASGDYSFSMGLNTYAVGAFSVAMGRNTSAHSGFEVVLGSFSTEYTPVNPYGWSENDRLFVIGNGMGDFAPSNAMTVLKSGKVGIGTSTPTALLHAKGTNLADGNVLFEGVLNIPFPPDLPVHTEPTRLLWYPGKAAFRAGRAGSDEWDKDNIGFFSTAMGYHTKASANASTAIGYNTIASGNYSVALGYYNTASGFASVALGSESAATGEYAITLARESIASGAYSTTIGGVTHATGDYSLATGYSSIADGNYSNAMGFHSSATGDNTTAIGFWSKAIGDYSTAIGDLARADGFISVAIGPGTRADAYASTAMGHYNIGGGDTKNWIETEPLFVIGNGISEQARKNALTILKNGNVGIGTSSPTALMHTSGTGTGEGNVLYVGLQKSTPGDPPASGAGTRMMWYPDKAAFRAGHVTSTQWNKDNIGFYSVVFGYNAKASGNSSTAVGVSTTASNYASTAIGNATTASGTSSTAFGNNTIASGENSTAMGLSTTASNSASTAMGIFTTASGYCSAALGDQTIASGETSIAMGYKSKASGYGTIATGESTTASGILSTAMGFNTTASATASLAVGYSTTASGSFSTAMGYSTIAKSGYETAIGRFNADYTPVSTTGWNTNDRLFVIGNGSSSASRSNAITVIKNGYTGIGTEWPSELLHINNSTGTAKLRVSSASTALSELTFYSGNSYVGAIGSDNANNYFYIYQGGNIIFKNGRIGIQSVTNPTFAVHLPNSTNDGSGKGRANAWTTYSDKRIKTATEVIQYGLSEIMQLQPVKYFQHNSKFDDGKLAISDVGANDIGFIAQDIFKIVPEIVSVPADENAELWGLNYEKLTPILVKAIQEQQMKIDELERKLELLLQKFSENK